MESLDAVKCENKLERLELEGKIVGYVRERVSKIPDYANLKHDAELVLLICNLVENAVKKKGQFDKKELVLSIHSKLFSHAANDKLVIENVIQFLFDHQQIKKLSGLKKGLHILAKILQKLL
jgi:hypothetical protein